MDFLGKANFAVRRFVALFSRNRLEDELREEMAAHVALRRRDFVAAGMDPATASAEARRLFGNATTYRERTRDMWGFPAVESILQDLRYGARSLRRSPVFTAVAVVSIAGGLAAGTGIFAFTNAVIFRPVATGDGESLYRIFTSDRSGTGIYQSSSYADYESFRQSTALAASCATEGIHANLRVGGVTQLHDGEIVSPGCFDAFRLKPEIGRFFTENQATVTAVPMPIVISYSLWMRRFGGDRSVVGRTMLLNGMSVGVVGVAPKGFAGTSLDGGADFWAPIHIAPVVFPPGTLQGRSQRMFAIFARLHDGVSREKAQAGLTLIAEQLRRLDPRAWTTESGGTRRVTIMRDTDARFAQAPGEVLSIVAGLIAAVGIIVAIACLNLATMLLARGASRARELSIRLAIGASRGRVLRQLATESLLIGGLGAGAALATVWAGLRLFEANRPSYIPAFNLAIDWRVIAFAIGLAMFAVVLFGLAPATHSLRLALAEGLKGRQVIPRSRRFRVGARDALIVLQVGASIALLLVSTLFVRAIADGSQMSPGFTTSGVAIVQVHLDAVADSEVPAVTARLLAAARNVPDVSDISLAGIVPLSGSNIGFHVSVDGGPDRVYHGNVVSPGYFRTLDIPIRSGRDFDIRDAKGGARTVIVSESFAKSAWGTTQVAGRRFVLDSLQVEVAGVVADIRYMTVTAPFEPLIYYPMGQAQRSRYIVHARVRGGGQTLAALDNALRSADRRVGVEGATPLRSYIDRAMIAERGAQWVGGIVGIVQLGLAVMALWGLVAYAVERRTSEMGIRFALGATPASLVRLTMRPAGLLIVVGVVIGAIVGAAVAKVVQSESVGLAPINFVAMIPVSAAFTVVALLAAWWPARRAGMADPAASLRRD